MKTSIYWQDPEYPAKRMDFIFDPSLALYLPLHRLDSASFMSKDAYGHPCTVTGALWTPRGRSFDGSDDQIDCGTGSGLDITGSGITLEAWINGTSFVTSPAYRGIICKDDTTNRWYFMIHSELTIIYCAIVTSTGTAEITTTTDLTGWNHIVFTYDGSYLRTYKNGAEVGTAVAHTGTINSVSHNVFIGCNRSTERWFKGLIGEARVYSRALTPPERMHNYLATKWRYR